ncbi:hypoxia induced protein conserved region-domain-containing protein [Russula earlei]|uniref:Hypoxia induced protein conserved region-domain-containing protein n=1 Tax=Russula earlei TaxID=71964 RepID=A0ACC0URM4_9AGAM|nr:hypoxia induced protein conserved region-domain-containing protein [Russula earlei]
MPTVSTETYRERALRKLKQQPLVPAGAAATTVALVIAMTKMRKGQSRSFNNWLRVRIVAQGLTVAAVVAGSWAYGAARPLPEVDDTAVAQERVAFQDRLRVAEEVTRSESGLAPSRSVQVTGVPTAEPTPSLPISQSRRS